MRTILPLSSFIISALIAAAAVAAESDASAPRKFVMHRVGTHRGESCGVSDFNNDGKLDIVAGPYLYLGPDWKRQKIREVAGDVDEEGKGYRWNFMDVPLDVDGDGLPDVVTCSWHGQKSEWYRNPGPGGGLWRATLIDSGFPFEHGDLWDVDGDGVANEIVPATPHTVWYEVGTLPHGKRGVLVHVVSEKKMDWGAGAGDVNGDGRPDLLRPNAWFEAPGDPRKGTWREHPIAIGSKEEGKADHTPHIFVYDVNGDGLGDIITSSAHGHGIFWYEQIKDGSETRWKLHLIDDSWSQAHSFALVDLDGDGDPDLVTGKRFMAHNGGDPDAFGPPGVYWYELKPGAAKPWTKHVISYDEGIGSGMNIPVADLDGDGDPDIVVTGKWGGPVWFENKSK